MVIIAFLTDLNVLTRILDHLKLPTQGTGRRLVFESGRDNQVFFLGRRFTISLLKWLTIACYF